MASGNSGSKRTFGVKDLELPLLVLLGLAGIWLAVDDMRFFMRVAFLLPDAHAYWSTGQDGYVPYQIALDHLDAYVYSPAFAQLIRPLTLLPWPAFAGLWIVLETASFLWLFRPLGRAWMIVLTLWCAPELLLGNIYGFIAAATVLGLSGWPQAWALPALTKPVLGIGLLWHVARGEWRLLGYAALTIVGITLASFAVDPTMWIDWGRFLIAESGEASWGLPVRLIVAIAVIVVAGRLDFAWLVPCALVLASPAIGGFNDLLILAAIPRLTLGPSGSLFHRSLTGESLP